jgi:hypothetical protein
MSGHRSDDVTATHGRCLCGDVAFAARLPSRWVAHCHCTLSQRSSGAAFFTWVGLRVDDVAVADTQRRLAWFASSPVGERGFCTRCGTTLFFRSPRWPGELHVTRPNFDGPVDREPQAHVFWDTHVDWVRLADDGLPRKTEAEVG